MRALHGIAPPGPVDLSRALEILDAPTDVPFADGTVAFCAEFARTLSRNAGGYPELQALAFWMRKSELVRTGQGFQALENERTVLVPAGSVLHFPPANVDTIFIYSWMLSLLCGNSNVVRLSNRSTPQTDLITSIVTDLLAKPEHARIAERNLMLTYDHDVEITTALSQRCDVRVIWGGDESVTRIRKHPIGPAAKDVTFPDRVSVAALAADYVAALNDEGLTALATDFYNDSYWFDQLGCSSPRLVTWVGDEGSAQKASARFFAALESIIEVKSHSVEVGTAIDKLTFAFGASVDRPVRTVVHRSNELSVLQLDAVEDISGEFCGGGLFYATTVPSLGSLTKIINRKYQTLSCAGFGREELMKFARTTNGMGIDRVVPVGQALTFNRFWDGKDLLQEFSRRVYVELDLRGSTSPEGEVSQ